MQNFPLKMEHGRKTDSLLTEFSLTLNKLLKLHAYNSVLTLLECLALSNFIVLQYYKSGFHSMQLDDF